MKLLINYDFFDAVRNVNEKTTPLKVFRNEKTKYALLLPVYTSIALIAKQYSDFDTRDIIAIILRAYGYLMSLDTLGEIMAKTLSYSKTDLYAKKASARLNMLALMLDDINVNTNYDMLLSSELYYKTSHIEYGDRRIPTIMSQKYIYVPAYGFDGEEKTVSILQEHIIGTKEYVLSQDEPDREYRRVLAKSHI